VLVAMSLLVYRRGFTALEFLIAIGVVVLLAAIISPLIGRSQEEKDIREGMHHLESSVELARRTAQVYKIRVLMHLQTGKNVPDSLTLTLPSLSQSALNESWDFLEAETKQYRFPESVLLMSDRDVIAFDETGHLAETAHLVLMSRKDPDLVDHLVIE